MAHEYASFLGSQGHLAALTAALLASSLWMICTRLSFEVRASFTFR